MNIKHLLILLMLFCLNLAFSQQISKQQLIDSLYRSEGEQYFKFKVQDLGQVNQLSKKISIDNVDPDSRTVYAYANRKEFSAFLEYNLPYVILPHPGELIQNPKMLDHADIRDITDWDFYPTYEAYVDMMNQFAADYPTLCQIINIGSTIQGRALLAAKISHNVSISENEPQFLYTSSIHGDETTGYVLMLHLIDYLLANYGQDDRITGMLDNMEIWINPLANPDGTYAGGNNTVFGAHRENANWVDLNRNYPDPADGPHPDGNEWQAETVSFMQLAENNHFVSSANLHGGAEVCNYPWDTWSRLTADNNWWVYVCREYADTVHNHSPSDYMIDLDNGITDGWAWYRITGGRQDYMDYFRHDREFTLEISHTKLLPANQLPIFWEYNYRSFLNYMEQSTFGIRGTVKDSITNWPLEAKVFVLSHEQDSSWVYSRLPNGNYHRLLYAGTYNVTYSAPGYFPKTVNNIQVSNRNASVVDVKLVQEGVGGIINEALTESIHIYPNPVNSDMVRITSDYEITRMSLFDYSGRLLLSEKLIGKSFEVPCSKFSDGVYILKFEASKGYAMKKLVITK